MLFFLRHTAVALASGAGLLATIRNALRSVAKPIAGWELAEGQRETPGMESAITMIAERNVVIISRLAPATDLADPGEVVR